MTTAETTTTTETGGRRVKLLLSDDGEAPSSETSIVRRLENDPSVRMRRLPPDFPSLTEKLYATWVSDGENLEAIRRLKPLLAALN